MSNHDKDRYISSLQNKVDFLENQSRQNSEAHAEHIEKITTYFNQLFEMIPEAIVITDKDGIVLRINGEFTRLFGYTAEEIIGRQLDPLIVPPDLIEEGSSLTSHLAQGGAPAALETRRLRKDGTLIDVAIKGKAIHIQGREEAVFGIYRDITEQNRIRNEILRLNETLEKRVQQRTSDLESALKELEAFNYSVSHDLKAPLRSIEGFSQILINDYANLLPEQGRDYLSRIQRNAVRMGNLIDSLLQLSRLSSNTMHLKPVNVTQMAREISDELQTANPGRTVSIAIKERMKAEADPELLHVILFNLLHNAWKFTSLNEQASIQVGTCKNSLPITTFFVRDNGVGFNQARSERLFGAFQRLHSEQEFPGTGIGLANVLRAVRRHGGKVWAESEEGRGATFYFTLSAAPA